MNWGSFNSFSQNVFALQQKVGIWELKKKNTCSNQMTEFSWTTRFFQKSVTMSRWSTVTPTRGHFSSTSVKEICFQREAKRSGVRRMWIRGREGGWTAVYKGGMCQPPLTRVLLDTSQTCSLYIYSLLFKCLSPTETGIWRNPLQELSLAQDPRGSSIVEPISEFTTEDFESLVKDCQLCEPLPSPASSSFSIYLTHIYRVSTLCQY